MADAESEKFVTPRHPTVGDAAGRHVPEAPIDAGRPTAPHITPLMQDAFIGRGTSRLLIVGFVLMMILPGIWALSKQAKTDSPLAVLLHHPTSQNIDAFSKQMLEQSPGNKWLKRTWGLAYARASGDPLGNVIIGHDGWLFYRLDFDSSVADPSLAGDQSPQVASLVQYSRDLEKRGIHFIVLPIPAKTAIMPQKLLPDYPMATGPALNPDYRHWVTMLRAQGVDVVDLTDAFWQMSLNEEMPFLAQDTHWTPQGMQAAAGLLAPRIRPFLGNHQTHTYTTKTFPYVSQGDLVDLAGAWGDTKIWPAERFPMTAVLEDGKPAGANDDAEVLLLGDSYTLAFADPEIFPLPGGLPQHLMLNLGTPVQYIAGHAGRFAGGREVLSQHPEILKNKKVVVWEFTSRVLPGTFVPLPAEFKQP